MFSERNGDVTDAEDKGPGIGKPSGDWRRRGQRVRGVRGRENEEPPCLSCGHKPVNSGAPWIENLHQKRVHVGDTQPALFIDIDRRPVDLKFFELIRSHVIKPVPPQLVNILASRPAVRPNFLRGSLRESAVLTNLSSVDARIVLLEHHGA